MTCWKRAAIEGLDHPLATIITAGVAISAGAVSITGTSSAPFLVMTVALGQGAERLRFSAISGWGAVR